MGLAVRLSRSALESAVVDGMHSLGQSGDR